MIENLPEKLRLMRIKNKMSQKEVASRINISVSVISDYETGNKTPSLGRLLKLAALFNCSTDYLLSHQQRNDTVHIDGLTSEQIRILNMVADEMKK